MRRFLAISLVILLAVAALVCTDRRALQAATLIRAVQIALSDAFSFTGTFTATNLNGLLYVDGTKYVNLAAAFAACPAAGCTIDMRGNPSALSLGTFDPGNNGPSVTLLLGPYFYTATQIVLRTNLTIRGIGKGTGVVQGTQIQAQSTSVPLFKTSTVATDQPASSVLVSDMTLFGPGFSNCTNTVSGSSTDGLLADASNSTTSVTGLWYSELRNITVCGFGGAELHFKGGTGASGANGVNQWVTMNQVVALRAQGGGSALRIEGANYQFLANNSQFDSSYQNSGLDVSAIPNIFIGGGPANGTSGFPYIIDFNLVTSQGAATCIQIDGAANVLFNKGHHEQCNGVYLVTFGSNGANVNTRNITVTGNSFNGTTGKNSSNGFLFKSTTANASGLIFKDNVYLAPGAACADNATWSTTGTASFSHADNFFDCTSAAPQTQGTTSAITAAATVTTGNTHSIVLSGATTVTTIASSLLPGEYITFQETNDGGFATGGNIDLGGVSQIAVLAGHTATFVRTDIASHTWQLVGLDNVPGSTFANLGTPTNGRIFYCSDCNIANPCTGGGTGALAKRLNGAWVCN